MSHTLRKPTLSEWAQIVDMYVMFEKHDGNPASEWDIRRKVVKAVLAEEAEVTVEDLSDGTTVISVDLPGFGSMSGINNYSTGLFTTQVAPGAEGVNHHP